MFDAACPFADPTLLDEAGLSSATGHVLLLYEVEVDDIFVRLVAVGAPHFEMPVLLRRYVDP